MAMPAPQPPARPAADPLAEALARVHRVFAEARVPYAVVGASAARLWGVAAEPAAVEVLAGLGAGKADDLVAAAKARGVGVDAGLAALATEDGDHLTLFPGGPRFVDVRPARGAGDQDALRTRVEVRLHGATAMVAAVEEVVARLLDDGTGEALGLASRLLERHRDHLDHGYLARRCDELGVRRLLREAGGEAGEAAKPSWLPGA